MKQFFSFYYDFFVCIFTLALSIQELFLLLPRVLRSVFCENKRLNPMMLKSLGFMQMACVHVCILFVVTMFLLFLRDADAAWTSYALGST